MSVARPSLASAVLLMLAAVLMFALMDAGLKLLSAHYPPLQVAALRGLSSLPLVTVWVLATVPARSLLRVHWPLHLLRGALAGLTLASMNIPQVLGYAAIAGMPAVTGLYTVLLPLVAFAVLGSSRHLVVAADSATAAIIASGLAGMAVAGSPRYVALVGAVAWLAAAFLLGARLFRLGFLADFFSRTVLVGFLTGVGMQVCIAMSRDMLGVPASRCWWWC